MTKALDIDLSDPRVRAVIDHDHNKLSLKSEATGRTMVQLAGDAPDPTGRMAGRGKMSTHRLDASKIEVLVSYRGRYGDFDLTCDVYALPGEPIEVVMICPKCQGGGKGKGSRIRGADKRIEFEQNNDRPYTFVDGSRMPTNGGQLSVEPFECAWELNNSETHVIGQRAGGINLCRMRLAIENSVAKDA